MSDVPAKSCGKFHHQEGQRQEQITCTPFHESFTIQRSNLCSFTTLPSSRLVSVEREAQRREFDPRYAAASNG